MPASAIAAAFAFTAALALASALALAACDSPRPLARFERVRDLACSCKDLPCAEDAERKLAGAIEHDRTQYESTPGQVPVIHATRRCLTTAWRAAQSPALFLAESEADQPARGPGPCPNFLEVAHRIMTCDRTPLSARTRVAEQVLSLRAFWDADGKPLKAELELYDECLWRLSSTLGVENCR